MVIERGTAGVAGQKCQPRSLLIRKSHLFAKKNRSLRSTVNSLFHHISRPFLKALDVRVDETPSPPDKALVISFLCLVPPSPKQAVPQTFCLPMRTKTAIEKTSHDDLQPTTQPSRESVLIVPDPWC